MVNKLFIIFCLINFIFCYNIFNHTQDYKIASSSYSASYNTENSFYNFLNPACNSDSNKFMYSVLGQNFDGILENQQLYFSINSEIFNNINIAFLRSSIDDIYDTSTAWNDLNQNGIVDIDEINYNDIGKFSHNTLGLILSKPISFNEFRFGINSKFSISNLFDQHSYTHSFDLGLYKKINHLKLGIVIKDILYRSYWSEGEVNSLETQIILGSNYNYKKINISFDYNFNKNEYLIGTNFNYNSSLDFQINHSTLEKLYLGFLVKFPKFNIGYSFILPKYSELGTSQRILIGINTNSFNLKL